MKPMSNFDVRAMQLRVRQRFAPTLAVDGFWGPRSQEACRAYLRSLMPNPNPWPKRDQASLRRFYGTPGDERNLVRVTFPYPMFYDGKRVLTTRVHQRCAESLVRVLDSIRVMMPSYPEIVDEAQDFDGIFNDRNKRGATTKSVHAWGAAIDLDADDNSFRNAWPTQSDMPLQIIEAFSREGWTHAGAFWGFDPMHFEATQP